MHKLFSLLLLLALVSSCGRRMSPYMDQNAFKNIKNITIHGQTGMNGPCEPSICISPKDPNIIVAGANNNNVYTSQDGGLSWIKAKMKSEYGVYGDPVVRINSVGEVFYAHLSNPSGKAYKSEDFLDRIVVQKSSDQGKTWSNGTYPMVNHKTDHDKPWMAIDPSGKIILMTWTEFDKYSSKDPKDKSRILFSKSEDEGLSWSEAIMICELEGDCLDDDNTTEGAIPAFDEKGNFYVVWSFNGKIYLDKSTDGGKTWLKRDKVIADQPGGWTFNIPGISRCNGLPMMKIDGSDGPGKGNMYVQWTDQRNGKDDTDIWFIKSTDNGETWSPINRVNDDIKGRQQFLSWMDVDVKTGFIYIVFYDRRNYEDNNTDVFLAYSIDQGKTFINTKISEVPFKPNSAIFFGDYNDISAYGGRVRPIWTRLDEHGLSVMTALIDVGK